MTFENLPNEVVLEIAGQAEHADLLSLSRCSRRLHSLTQQTLYATFKQTDKHAVPNLLRSIIREPYLAAYIKHLDMTLLSRYESFIPDINVSFISKRDEKWIRARLLEKMGRGKELFDTWLYRLMHLGDNWDILAGLLLLLCSDTIESIKMAGTQNVTNVFELVWPVREANAFPSFAVCVYCRSTGHHPKTQQPKTLRRAFSSLP
jgi:hypothetical protein